MSICESLSEFFGKCPALSEYLPIGVDFLDGQRRSASVSMLPGEKVAARFVSGSQEREARFSLSLRVDTFTNKQRKLAASAIESAADWVREQSEICALPALAQGKSAVGIIPEGGYRIKREKGGRGGEYSAVFRLRYFLEG